MRTDYYEENEKKEAVLIALSAIWAYLLYRIVLRPHLQHKGEAAQPWLKVLMLLLSSGSASALITQRQTLDAFDSISQTLTPIQFSASASNPHFYVGYSVAYVTKTHKDPFIALISQQGDSEFARLDEVALTDVNNPIFVDHLSHPIKCLSTPDSTFVAYGLWQGESVRAFATNELGSSQSSLLIQSLDSAKSITIYSTFVAPFRFQNFGAELQFVRIGGKNCLVFTSTSDPVNPSPSVFVIRDSLPWGSQLSTGDNEHGAHFYRLSLTATVPAGSPIVPLNVHVRFKAMLPFGSQLNAFFIYWDNFSSPNAAIAYWVPESSFSNPSNSPSVSILLTSTTKRITLAGDTSGGPNRFSFIALAALPDFDHDQRSALILGRQFDNNGHGSLCIIPGTVGDTLALIDLTHHAYCLHSDESQDFGVALAVLSSNQAAIVARDEVWLSTLRSPLPYGSSHTLDVSPFVEVRQIKGSTAHQLNGVGPITGQGNTLLIGRTDGALAYFIFTQQSEGSISRNMIIGCSVAGGIILLATLALLLRRKSLSESGRSWSDFFKRAKPTAAIAYPLPLVGISKEAAITQNPHLDVEEGTPRPCSTNPMHLDEEASQPCSVNPMMVPS